MRGKKLLKNTVIISIGKICTSLITFLLLPLYTGILSTEEYGIVDLLNTLMSLLLPLVGLQIEKGVFRNLIEVRGKKDEEVRNITTGFISLIFQSIVFIILFSTASLFIKNDYKIFLLVNVIGYIFVSFFQQVARGIGETAKYTIGSFVSAAGTILFNVIFLVIFKIGVYGMLLGTLSGFVASIVYFIFSLKLYKYIKIKNFKKEILKDLLRYSLPLIPNALSWWIFAASDRVIVSSLLGVDMNGVLAASLKFSTIITTLYNIFDTSWIESISVNINDKDVGDYFNNVFNIIVKLFASIGIGMIAFMPFVFPIMINEKFAFGYNLIPISIASTIFNVTQGLVAVVYAAKKNTKSIAKTSVFSAIINASLHLILIKSIGLYAAVLSTLVAFAILSMYRVHDVSEKYFKIKIDYKSIFMILLAFIFVTIAYYINELYINILSIIIAVIFGIVINIRSISFFKNIILKKLLKKEGK